jgi:hypothetical protein
MAVELNRTPNLVAAVAADVGLLEGTASLKSLELASSQRELRDTRDASGPSIQLRQGEPVSPVRQGRWMFLAVRSQKYGVTVWVPYQLGTGSTSDSYAIAQANGKKITLGLPQNFVATSEASRIAKLIDSGKFNIDGLYAAQGEPHGAGGNLLPRRNISTGEDWLSYLRRQPQSPANTLRIHAAEQVVAGSDPAAAVYSGAGSIALRAGALGPAYRLGLIDGLQQGAGDVLRALSLGASGSRNANVLDGAREATVKEAERLGVDVGLSPSDRGSEALPMNSDAENAGTRALYERGKVDAKAAALELLGGGVELRGVLAGRATARPGVYSGVRQVEFGGMKYFVPIDGEGRMIPLEQLRKNPQQFQRYRDQVGREVKEIDRLGIRTRIDRDALEWQWRAGGNDGGGGNVGRNGGGNGGGGPRRVGPSGGGAVGSTYKVRLGGQVFTVLREEAAPLATTNQGPLVRAMQNGADKSAQASALAWADGAWFVNDLMRRDPAAFQALTQLGEGETVKLVRPLGNYKLDVYVTGTPAGGAPGGTLAITVKTPWGGSVSMRPSVGSASQPLDINDTVAVAVAVRNPRAPNTTTTTTTTTTGPAAPLNPAQSGDGGVQALRDRLDRDTIKTQAWADRTLKQIEQQEANAQRRLDSTNRQLEDAIERNRLLDEQLVKTQASLENTLLQEAQTNAVVGLFNNPLTVASRARVTGFKGLIGAPPTDSSELARVRKFNGTVRVLIERLEPNHSLPELAGYLNAHPSALKRVLDLAEKNLALGGGAKDRVPKLNIPQRDVEKAGSGDVAPRRLLNAINAYAGGTRDRLPNDVAAVERVRGFLDFIDLATGKWTSVKFADNKTDAILWDGLRIAQTKQVFGLGGQQHQNKLGADVVAQTIKDVAAVAKSKGTGFEQELVRLAKAPDEAAVILADATAKVRGAANGYNPVQMETLRKGVQKDLSSLPAPLASGQSPRLKWAGSLSSSDRGDYAVWQRLQARHGLGASSSSGSSSTPDWTSIPDNGKAWEHIKKNNPDLADTIDRAVRENPGTVTREGILALMRRGATVLEAIAALKGSLLGVGGVPPNNKPRVATGTSPEDPASNTQQLHQELRKPATVKVTPTGFELDLGAISQAGMGPAYTRFKGSLSTAETNQLLNAFVKGGAEAVFKAKPDLSVDRLGDLVMLTYGLRGAARWHELHHFFGKVPNAEGGSYNVSVSGETKGRVTTLLDLQTGDREARSFYGDIDYPRDARGRLVRDADGRIKLQISDATAKAIEARFEYIYKGREELFLLHFGEIGGRGLGDAIRSANATKKPLLDLKNSTRADTYLNAVAQAGLLPANPSPGLMGQLRKDYLKFDAAFRQLGTDASKANARDTLRIDFLQSTLKILARTAADEFVKIPKDVLREQYLRGIGLSTTLRATRGFPRQANTDFDKTWLAPIPGPGTNTEFRDIMDVTTQIRSRMGTQPGNGANGNSRNQGN